MSIVETKKNESLIHGVLQKVHMVFPWCFINFTMGSKVS
jgi:hypothetical protein